MNLIGRFVRVHDPGIVISVKDVETAGRQIKLGGTIVDADNPDWAPFIGEYHETGFMWKRGMEDTYDYEVI